MPSLAHEALNLTCTGQVPFMSSLFATPIFKSPNREEEFN